MAQMAIQVLWFLIGLIVLCGVVYLAIYVVEMFVMPIPDKIKQGIWVIILLLALIALLTVLVGGGGGFQVSRRPGRVRWSLCRHCRRRHRISVRAARLAA